MKQNKNKKYKKKKMRKKRKCYEIIFIKIFEHIFKIKLELG